MSEIPTRKSCDKTVSPYGKDLLSFCKVYSMVIMHGRCGHDLKGSFTYISQQGCSLIDYILCSPDLLPFVLDFKIETRTESKHLPVSVNFKNHITFKSTMPGTNNPGLSRTLTTRFNFLSSNREIFKQNLENLFKK